MKAEVLAVFDCSHNHRRQYPVTTLQEVEPAHIFAALPQTNRYISGNNCATKILALSRLTPDPRMKKLGIPDSPSQT